MSALIQPSLTRRETMGARSAREYIQPSMLAPAAAVGEMDRAIAFAQQALDDKDP